MRIVRERTLYEAVQAEIDAGAAVEAYNGVNLMYWIIWGVDEETIGHRCVVGLGLQDALENFFKCPVFVYKQKKPGRYHIRVQNAYIGTLYEVETKSTWYVHDHARVMAQAFFDTLKTIR